MNYTQLIQILEEDRDLKFLPEWQTRCLIPFVFGRSVAAIALEVGRPSDDVRSAIKSPLFKEALRVTTQLLYEASGRLGAASTVEAVETLRDLMRDKEVSPSDRIRAARIILQRGDTRDRDALLKRLEELEERLEANES